MKPASGAAKSLPVAEYTISSDAAAFMELRPIPLPSQARAVAFAITLPAELYELALRAGIDLGPAPGEAVH